MHSLTRLFVLASLVGCAGESDDATSFDPSTFEGGTFQFTTTGVQDGCYDGAFKVIFMPEGTANDWDVTTEVPGMADLPYTYDATLPDPYSAMQVTVEGTGTDTFEFVDGLQIDVEVDADAYPGCLIDMDITATFTIIDADTFQGQATLATEGYDELSCPVVQSEPCDIDLDLSASRL